MSEHRLFAFYRLAAYTGARHADLWITLRVYAHVIRQHAAGIADVFAAAVDEDQADEGGSALTSC